MLLLPPWGQVLGLGRSGETCCDQSAAHLHRPPESSSKAPFVVGAAYTQSLLL